MRALFTLAVLLVAAVLTLAPAPGHAQVEVVFGESWDGSGLTLQKIVDARYGMGNIDVRTDYIGHDPGDLDPFFWIDTRLTAFVVEEVAGFASSNVLGWYAETGGTVVIDGIADGVVYHGSDGEGDVATVNFDGPVFRWGFYLDPNGSGASINAPQGEYFFTNRLMNDRGASGGGAMHAPFDGDVQALIFDVSPWTQADTWLVAFDDLDTGVSPGPCCSDTDNDFNDFVFEVTAYTVTDALPLTFGGLKRRYR